MNKRRRKTKRRKRKKNQPLNDACPLDKVRSKLSDRKYRCLSISMLFIRLSLNSLKSPIDLLSSPIYLFFRATPSWASCIFKTSNVRIDIIYLEIIYTIQYKLSILLPFRSLLLVIVQFHFISSSIHLRKSYQLLIKLKYTHISNKS
jgi:hypothetical protein